jgi:small subunit ribosomal protein S6
MRAYEITNILLDHPQTVTEETKNTVKDILKKYSVEITGEEDWGQKKLWHKINGYESGAFYHLRCKAEPKIIANLENEFKLNQNILRSLIVSA